MSPRKSGSGRRIGGATKQPPKPRNPVAKALSQVRPKTIPGIKTYQRRPRTPGPPPETNDGGDPA